MVCIHTENQNQGDFYPFVLLEISVLHESPLGHLRYLLTDVPPQPNSPPDNVFNPDRPVKDLESQKVGLLIPAPPHWISKKTIKVVVFQRRRSSHLCYTLYVFSQCQTRVKLNLYGWVLGKWTCHAPHNYTFKEKHSTGLGPWHIHLQEQPHIASAIWIAWTITQAICLSSILPCVTSCFQDTGFSSTQEILR